MTHRPSPPTPEANDPQSTAAGWQAPLLDLLLALSRHPRLIAGIMIAAAAISVYSVKTSTPYYRSSAVAVLLQREKPAFDASIDMGTLETPKGVGRSDAAVFALPPNTELYVTLMRARTTLLKLVADFGERLEPYVDAPGVDWADEVAARIGRMITITGTEQGLLTVSVKADDPELAADLANATLAEGENASIMIERELLLRQASFLDESVKTASISLEHARRAFEAFSQRHALIDPRLEANQTVHQLRELRRELDQIKTDLEARLLHYTEADPEVKRMRAMIAERESQVESHERAVIEGVDRENYGRLWLEYEDMSQNVRFRQDLLATLSAQAEIYRIRARQATGSLAVIRPATAGVNPAGPEKKKILGITLGAGLFLAVGLCILLEQLAQIGRDRILANKLDDLRGEWAFLPVVGRWIAPKAKGPRAA